MIKHTGLNGIPRYLAIALLTTFALACGKIGPPVPPRRFSERTSQLQAVQKGSNIILSWPAPQLGAKDSSRQYIARAEIYRVAERRGEEQILDPDDFKELAELVGVIDRAKIETQAAGGILYHADSIDLAADLSEVRLRYGVLYFNRRDEEALLSNTIAIEPASIVAKPPRNLRLTGEEQDAVSLAWDPPDSNIGDTVPASVAGYNVYRQTARRAAAGAQLGRPLNGEPLLQPAFVDRQFRYGPNYIYTVRALSPGAAGTVESFDSNRVDVQPADKFPPAAPDPLTIASTNGTISLFWPTSSENDVTGYNLYRAAIADGKENDWIKLNRDLLTKVTYHDEKVEIGARYSYRVTAVDKFNNESPPSRTASETANP